MLFHVTADLSWPTKAETWVVIKSVSESGQDGRRDQFWDKHETIGSQGGEKGERDKGIRGETSSAGKFTVTQLSDSEI